MTVIDAAGNNPAKSAACAVTTAAEPMEEGTSSAFSLRQRVLASEVSTGNMKLPVGYNGCDFFLISSGLPSFLILL